MGKKTKGLKNKNSREEGKSEEEKRITCYVNGNCDRFFDDFYNLKSLIILICIDKTKTL